MYGHALFQREILVFSTNLLIALLMTSLFIARKCFFSEQCGPWASCYMFICIRYICYSRIWCIGISRTSLLFLKYDPFYLPLADSWVDLESSSNSTGALHSIHNGNSEVEKLLIEAQKESRSPSRANSKESSAQGR